jgi:hypothetical protein
VPDGVEDKTTTQAAAHRRFFKLRFMDVRIKFSNG